MFKMAERIAGVARGLPRASSAMAGGGWQATGWRGVTRAVFFTRGPAPAHTTAILPQVFRLTRCCGDHLVMSAVGLGFRLHALPFGSRSGRSSSSGQRPVRGDSPGRHRMIAASASLSTTGRY